MSLTHGPLIVRSGLLTCLDAANPKSYPGSGTAVYDATGTLTYSTSGLTVASGAFVFNGSSTAITSTTSLFNRSTGEAMTVSCWMNPSRLSGQYQALVVNRNDSAYNWMLYQHATDGAIQLHGANQNKSTYIPTVGVWIYVVATVDGAGNSLLYINGTVQQTVTGYTYNISSPGLLCIGKFGTASEYYQGSISNVVIYNRALPATEISQNFNAVRGRYGI